MDLSQKTITINKKDEIMEPKQETITVNKKEETKDPNQEIVTISEFYVDAVKLASSPYTMRMLIGQDTNGTFSPQLALSFSPQFALQLHQILGDAVDYYRKSFAEIQLPKPPQERDPK